MTKINTYALEMQIENILRNLHSISMNDQPDIAKADLIDQDRHDFLSKRLFHYLSKASSLVRDESLLDGSAPSDEVLLKMQEPTEESKVFNLATFLMNNGYSLEDVKSIANGNFSKKEELLFEDKPQDKTSAISKLIK
jgi:hypothetical protein